MSTTNHVFKAQALGGDKTSEPFTSEGRPLLSAQTKWTGTPTGALSLEGSNNYHPGRLAEADATWTAVTLETDFEDPAGGAGDDLVDLSFIPYRWLRIKYTDSSSDANDILDAWVYGQRIG